MKSAPPYVSVSLPILSCLFLLTAIAPISITAQISVYPTTLYAGLNKLTVTADKGIKQIRLLKRERRGSSWERIPIGYENDDYKIITAPIFGQCSRTASFIVLVKTITRQVELPLMIVDCDDDDVTITPGMAEVWNVYYEDFGTLQLGESSCQTFTVQSAGRGFVIDSVSSPSPAFSIVYSGRVPPFRLPISGIFRYQVCYTATRTGTIRTPINVYLRRDQPSGRYTNFIVADTAVVRVTPSPQPAAKPPKKNSVITMRIIRPKPKPPVDIEPTVLRQRQQEPPEVASALVTTTEKPIATIAPEEKPTDPTTFRSIIGPTARPLAEGQNFIASYDGLGWLFGRGMTDDLTVMGGFLYVPPLIENVLAITAGGKYQLHNSGAFRWAAGVQLNYSHTDESDIVLAAPYTVATYGDDDHAVSATAGYTWRRHNPVDEEPFERQTPVIGIGGDYRIARNWKLVGEGYLLPNANYQPLAVTARFFTDKIAIDAGLTFDISGESDVPLTPAISAVYVW